MFLATQLPAGPDTVCAAFQAAATQYAHKPLICVPSETAAVYDIPLANSAPARFRRSSTNSPAPVVKAGFGHGRRAGILPDNRPDFFLSWCALNALGVSVVPINPELRSAELECLIDHSEMAAALGLTFRQSDLAAAAKAVGRTLGIFRPNRRIEGRKRGYFCRRFGPGYPGAAQDHPKGSRTRTRLALKGDHHGNH